MSRLLVDLHCSFLLTIRVICQSIQEFLRNLLDLVVFFGLRHQLIILLRQERPLTGNNFSDLVLFLPTQVGLRLVEKRA